MNVYITDFDETKYMSFDKNDKLLRKDNRIWDRVSKVIKNRFDGEPLYNDKYFKTKIKSYQGIINPNFHGNNVPKDGFQYISYR